MARKIVAVIDLGSSKIAAALAGLNKNGNVSLLALESMHSRGIKGGDITDINKATEDISSIMKNLGRAWRRRVKNVFVTSKAADIRMDISRGIIPLSKTPREITKRDVEKCLEIAAMVRLPLERAVVERIVRGFHIDGGGLNAINPVGLYGIKLEAEVFIATANKSKMQNIAKCIDHAGFLLNGIYLSSTSCANSVLDENEKEKGVLFLDIGDSLTEALVFKNGMLKSFRVIGKGASDILDKKTSVDKESLDALLKDAVAASAAERKNFSSIVVTGGGALIDNVIEETEETFGLPARIGIVKNAARNLNSQDAIIHTSTIGLIGRLAKEYKAYHTNKGLLHRAFRKILDIYESYF